MKNYDHLIGKLLKCNVQHITYQNKIVCKGQPIDYEHEILWNLVPFLILEIGRIDSWRLSSKVVIEKNVDWVTIIEKHIDSFIEL